MGKLFIFLVICSGIWYVQNTYDFSNVKENMLNTMKQEKTVNTVNSHRAGTQSDINNIVNGN